MPNNTSNTVFSPISAPQSTFSQQPVTVERHQSVERALLSPSSSRYAFTTVDANMASLSLNDSIAPIGGNDLPALKPVTAAALDSFTNDLQAFNVWVTRLSVDQQKTALSLILDSIKDHEVIQLLSQKINQIQNELNTPMSPQLNKSTMIPPTIRAMSPLLSTGLDTNNVTSNISANTTGLDSLLSSPESTHISHYIQPAPARVLSPLLRTGYSSLLNEQPMPRPRSADPLSQGLYEMQPIEDNANTQFGFVPMQMPKSTNYHLQQQQQQQQNSHHHHHHHNHHSHNHNSNQQQQQQQQHSGANAMSELMSQPLLRALSGGNTDLDQRGRGRFLQSKMMKSVNSGYNNSTSAPPINRVRSSVRKETLNITSMNPSTSNNIVTTATATSTSTSNNGMPKDIASDELLNNIPAWLKALRLHKYTENLKHLKWQEMIELNDAELDKLGVSTVGARNKLLKSFAAVKEKKTTIV